MEKGFVTQVCSVYDCTNGANCEHMNMQVTTSHGSKCNKMYVVDGYNFCPKCRDDNRKKKNAVRDQTIQLKKDLGGECVDCEVDKLYILEFDHIDPSKKTKQITRMAPKDWNKEIDNIALRCANCHRIKSYQEQSEQHKDNTVSKKRRQELNEPSNKVKLSIGGCQICGWTCVDNEKLCVVLEFDHINDDKSMKMGPVLVLDGSGTFGKVF